MSVISAELTEFAAEQQRRFDDTTSAADRKERGHFGTPPVIADFMATMIPKFPNGIVRILDAGAGVGTLSAAVCQRVLNEGGTQHLVFELWENDRTLYELLRATMANCQQALGTSGIEMEFVIHTDDFILANTQKSLFADGPSESFHLAILNPPYFKLRKDSQHARTMDHIVHGQPNIYAFFMAVAADLLLPGGELIAITPRSYFNGPYFGRFRKWFFDRLAARQIHIFESREEAFRDDAVLQENVILRAEKGGHPKDIYLTTSAGREFTEVKRILCSYDTIIDNSNGDHIIRVATNSLAAEIVDAIDNLPKRFRDFGFEISTGPVVTFRSTDFLRDVRADDTAPLLWMHNVRPFITQFPPKNGKPLHILVSEASRKLLVPAKTYVLLKRFTAKEEKRRLVAGIVHAADSYSDWIGLENHLNYVYRKDAELSRPEAFGLAAFFNSALVDQYFRAISGNTQVNATEIRGMPLPDEKTLEKIGNEIIRTTTMDSHLVEQIVCRALGLRTSLLEHLIGIGHE